jgi:hypothetical protein
MDHYRICGLMAPFLAAVPHTVSTKPVSSHHPPLLAPLPEHSGRL